MSDVNLPAVITTSKSIVGVLTHALGVSRSVLAPDDEIEHAWDGLPRLLSKIPPALRDPLLARMCVAVSVGLFDSAINYIWNSAVIALRNKVKGFGLHVVPQVIARDFDEKALTDLKDAQLLELCLSLNLITEDAYFFLDQCREIRNNFSAAHPAIGTLDDHEVLQFLNRCAKYALSDTSNPKGVDAQAFLAALKGARFTGEQTEKWNELLRGTHDAQRELLIGTLHGIYCDPDASQQARLNALDVCRHFADELSPRARSELINRHNEYISLGKADRQAASLDFFAKLGLISLLADTEKHAIISRACKRLMSVHMDFNNFYNEPPHAERLRELSTQAAIPESAQYEYVCSVVTCAAGNQYGYSFAATQDYEAMIRNFSPREVAIMLEATKNYPTLANRFRVYKSCQQRYKQLVGLIAQETVPATHLPLYKSLGA